MNIATKLVGTIDRMEALDAISGPLVKIVQRAVQPRLVRNLASGTWIGHPMHPLLTDVPIGAWTMSALLDVVGGESAEHSADVLVKTGILAAVPTAMSGLNDWSDTYGPETRLGLVHATCVDTALVLYIASAVCRSRGKRGKGKMIGLMGLGALTAGGYLGGHLSFGKGVNVNAIAHEEGPSEWTAVLDDNELGDGEHRKVDAAGTAVLLYRSPAGLYAIGNTCSHMGGPLDEGEFDGGCVTCPWHGSRFRLADGTIDRGPACHEQPVYDTRVVDGRIEVRTAS